jgi:uncharacterized cupredoxin-like copper-binding protein
MNAVLQIQTMPKKTRLTDLDIHILSLVDKAANQRTLIIKNSNIPAGTPEIERTILIRKVDEDAKKIYSIVYAPGELDAHGEYADKSEVEKACYGFMRKSKNNSVDTQHDCVIDKDCFVAENWIVRKGDALFPDKKDLNAWAVCIKVDNDEIWQKIKKGEITGVSMWGTGKKIEEDGSVEKAGFYEMAKSFFTDGVDPVVKEFEDRMKRYELKTACDALSCEVFSVLHNDLLSIKERQEEVLAVAEQFIDYVDEIEIAKELIAKEGRTLSNKNLSAIRTALKNLNDILAAADSKEEKVEKLKKSIVEKTEKTAAEDAGNKSEVAKTEKETIAELTEKNKTLAEQVAKLKGESKGSDQEPEAGSGDQKPVKKAFNWLG